MKIVVGIVLVIVGLVCIGAYFYFASTQRSRKTVKPPSPQKKEESISPVSPTVLPQNPKSRDIAKLVVQSDSEAAARVIRRWLREKE